MEIRNRSPAFESIRHQADADLRDLLAIPSSCHVPFTRGGAIAANVAFFLREASLESVCLKESAVATLVQLTGDESVGGMRASIYNAMSKRGSA